jgi:hypothetical protein
MDQTTGARHAAFRRSTNGLSPPPAAFLEPLQHEEAEHAGQRAADEPGQHVAPDAHADRVEDADEGGDEDPRAYSHSIVPGGLLVMSSTTRLTSRISLIMREAICSSSS